ncbi:MAG: hypothetical protein LBQ52_09870 [Helicobacteraceae bacterium]|jgi:hypothetical protein|nr:hypothetical protein [Helicobacteraceae bacterium]
MKLVFLASCFAFSLLACGAKTTITGRVQIYGNEPHTFVGVIDDKGVEYSVYPKEKEKELRDLQGRLIKFNVEFIDNSQTDNYLLLKGGVITPLSWKIIK